MLYAHRLYSAALCQKSDALTTYKLLKFIKNSGNCGPRSAGLNGQAACFDLPIMSRGVCGEGGQKLEEREGVFAGGGGCLTGTELMPILVVGVFGLVGRKPKSGKGKRKPNSEPGPNPEPIRELSDSLRKFAIRHPQAALSRMLKDFRNL